MAEQPKPRRHRTLVQVSMPSDLLDEIDAAIARGERSAFIIRAIRAQLKQERKREGVAS